jgi:hypothetical protein
MERGYDYITRISNANEFTKAAANRSSAEWLPELPPPTIFAGDIADEIVRSIDSISTDELRDIFDLVEDSLLHSTMEEKQTICTGFLEELLAKSSSGEFSFARIIPFLGDKARQYCLFWDQFTGVKTPGLTLSNCSVTSRSWP